MLMTMRGTAELSKMFSSSSIDFSKGLTPLIRKQTNRLPLMGGLPEIAARYPGSPPSPVPPRQKPQAKKVGFQIPFKSGKVNLKKAQKGENDENSTLPGSTGSPESYERLQFFWVGESFGL